MRKRGANYWHWSDCLLDSTVRRLTADCGIQIELRARFSRQSIAQLFVGVYDGNGLPLVEEYYAHCPEDSVTEALEWGQKRGFYLTESINNKQRSRIWPISMRHASNDAPPSSLAEKVWSRAAFMNQAQAAQTRYLQACREMVAIMKRTKVLKDEWEKCRIELNAAIDHRAAVLRINGLSMYQGSVDDLPSKQSVSTMCSRDNLQPGLSKGYDQQPHPLEASGQK